MGPSNRGSSVSSKGVFPPTRSSWFAEDWRIICSVHSSVIVLAQSPLIS